MPLDLTLDDQLKQALLDIKPWDSNPKWLSELEGFLTYVQKADFETRRTKEFQQRLWDDNAVSGVGMGTVDLGSALDDSSFRDWLAETSLQPLGETADARLAQFRSLHDGIVEKLKAFASRTPRVKIFRLLAAFYPRHFSTITYGRMALECHRAWFGKVKKPDPVARQIHLMDRIDSLLGPCADDARALAERMTLPWFVYERHVQSASSEAVAETANPLGEIELKPLPAIQRRKGFTSIKGGLGTISSALSFVVDGVSREELMDYLKAEFPDYRDSSLRTLMNILKNEFYVIQENDGVITQTARGELYLENNDPQELIPLFLTRTLGVDHVLCALAEHELSTTDLIILLKEVNPGWTTDFAPRAMLKWLRDFGLLEVDTVGVYSLSEAGRSWAEQINWHPEKLQAVENGDVAELSSTDATLNMASLDQTALLKQVISNTAFPARIVSQLHFGLWAHARRHFAVLAGLSGSGKTLLAQRYAEALAAQFAKTPAKNVFVQAVQPGWYDPAPLFGYINPLVSDNYVRPPLLDFLLQAAAHPDQPYTVILDEMNLSHPEQYFAPVLSAMESGDRLRLHNEGDSFDGVPSTIAYPSNVAFIGTVNMDETTHGLSDKVLDRAFTLEFWDITLADYPNWNSHGLVSADVVVVRSCLEALLTVLAPERLHFGWRTVEDVLSYLALASKASDFELMGALDDVVYARVLPKLRGSESQRLHDVLHKAAAVLEQQGLKRSCTKVRMLKADLADTGMMRFWR
ncbi:McrB family protein [Neptuniibacter halophilus]|uniref:McrB family protein n=1 Tax=Neptuniibacter halophilus TaxID=651666 RepID=UPI002572A606|nr:hypothetical protein [Neptuniibacter halophilus]